MSWEIRDGDCREVMASMAASSVDAIVTDPPYGLSFMGKGWDHGVPGVEFWTEAIRVAKPGAHLLAFGGTRTYHRLACAIEDAGWEIRDCVMWVYGSGFPKSLDVSKAIDKVRDWSKVERLNLEIKRAREAAGLSLKEIGEAMHAATDGQYGSWYHRGGHMFFETGRNLPSRPEWDWLRKVLPIASEFYDAYDAAEREVVGVQKNAMSGWSMDGATKFIDRNITAPATEAAKQWQGWGTALKPAWEPVIVARKPLAGTVAANVLEHGTGAINVDGCRVGTEDMSAQFDREWKQDGTFGNGKRASQGKKCPPGRWPANLIHDGSEEATAPMGEAARYFYCAKASKADRDEGNNHPTVKPTDLMAYLCRLVTPPGGTVLDPFCGSGSTGKAAVREGFGFIGIEREAEYAEIARCRIQAVLEGQEPDLFG